jgi:hypothetical protein
VLEPFGVIPVGVDSAESLNAGSCAKEVEASVAGCVEWGDFNSPQSVVCVISELHHSSPLFQRNYLTAEALSMTLQRRVTNQRRVASNEAVLLESRDSSAPNRVEEKLVGPETPLTPPVALATND